MIDLTSRKEEEFPVPAQKLWDVVSDFGTVEEWWPAGMLSKVEIEGDGIGMVRSIHTVIGIVLHEKLETLDNESRKLTLSIVGDLPAGMEDYNAAGSVTENGAGSCTLVWEGHYQVPDADAETGARQFIEGAYGAMFAGLRDHVTKEG
jgi:hypothetical protein